MTFDTQNSEKRSHPKHRPKQERLIIMGLLAVMGGVVVVDMVLLSSLF